MTVPDSSGGVRRRRLSRRSVLSIGALSAAGAALSACGTPSVGAASPPSGPDLVVGACLELSGTYRVVGQAQNDALSIVASMVQDQGGFVIGGRTRQVKLVVIDNAGDPKLAVQQTRTLINQQNVAAIIGSSGSETSLAMAPVVESLTTPMLSLSAADAVTQPIASRQWVYKLGPNSDDVADIMVRAMIAGRRTKIAVMATDDPNGTDGLDAITTALQSHNLEAIRTVSLPVGPPTSLNFSAQAATIAAAKPDAVVIWALSPAAGFAARALHTAGYAGEVYFDPGAASANTLTTVASAAFAGVYVVNPQVLGGPPQPATTPDDAAKRDFFLRYTQKNLAFDGLASYAADALRIVVNAATLAQSFDRAAIQKQMESNTFTEISGAYVFSSTSHGGVQADSLAVFQLKPTGWIQVS